MKKVRSSEFFPFNGGGRTDELQHWTLRAIKLVPNHFGWQITFGRMYNNM